MTKPLNLRRVIFDKVKVTGIYERDLLMQLAIEGHSTSKVVEAIDYLAGRGYIRKCGDKIRPLYVRSESARVVYQNLTPLDQRAAQVLLQMHSNFEENAR